MKAWMLFFLLFGCGSANSVDVVSIRPFDFKDRQLLVKKELYLKLIENHQDEHGWIETKECDALLFSGLVWGAGLDMNIYAGRDNTGRWYRTPSQSCYREGRSGSTISRDMLIGLMYGMFMRSDVQGLLDLYHYGKARNWKMGDGPADRTQMTVNMIVTLYKLLDKSYRGVIPELWIDPIKDHQRHIVALNVLLRSISQGSIPTAALNVVKGFANKDPNNALYKLIVAMYTDGNLVPTLELLVRDDIFPKDRLPVRYRRWLWEKHSSGWDGEPKVEQSGGDYLFLIHTVQYIHNKYSKM